MGFSHEIGHRRFFSWGGLYKKMFCLKRKSHVLSVLAPPMRKSPVSCLMRKSHVSRENLISYQFGPPPMRKSPVSYLRRKCHVSRENLMSFHFRVPPQRENLLSPVS